MQLPYSVPDLVDWQQPVNYAHPLNRGLVSWWLATPRGFGSTRWLDLCNRHHGTLTNMDPATDWVGPRGGPGWGSLDFARASSQYVLAASSSKVSGSSNYTWAAWVRPGTIGAVDRTIIGERPSSGNWISKIGLASGPASVSGTFPFGRTTDAFEFVLRDDAGTLRFICGDSAINDGEWHFVAGVRRGSEAAVYWSEGGILNTTGFGSLGSLGSTTGSSPQLRIGGDAADANGYFDGLVGSGLLSRTSWSESQVRQFFDLSRQHYPGLLNRITLPWYSVQDAGGGNNELAAWYYYAQL